MKLSAYIVRVDTGFSPNPFGRRCTLACCKPSIRRNAKCGDIIIGTASAHSGLSGRLIYAMRVGSVIPFQTYWEQYPSKRPSKRTVVSKRGDNIWHQDAFMVWRGVPAALHDDSHREHDIGGENVLVASEFYYFGRKAIPIPAKFTHIVAATQGHKNADDIGLINSFWKWLSHTSSKRGRIGLPSEFTDTACCRHGTDADKDEDACE
jgi:hypothetical protein